jgi:DNA-binding NarL/FixJ family response regulator
VSTGSRDEPAPGAHDVGVVQPARVVVADDDVLLRAGVSSLLDRSDFEVVSARRRDDPLAVLSPRELEVLALMAEGRSNAGIAQRLWVTEGTVEKHVRSTLTKLNLPETGDDHRRVLAVVTFLESR